MRFIECQAADPRTHDLCARIARRCVGVIEPLLRQEEVHEALTEFYRAARDEIDLTKFFQAADNETGPGDAPVNARHHAEGQANGGNGHHPGRKP